MAPRSSPTMLSCSSPAMPAVISLCQNLITKPKPFEGGYTGSFTLTHDWCRYRARAQSILDARPLLRVAIL